MINLENAKVEQTLLGFGTSACWWSQNVANSETATELANLLYSKDGLGLNIYRYNIGAGWDKDNCRVPNPWRRCESFYIHDPENEDENYFGGGYDFSKDKNAYSFMKTCLSLGTIDTVILFANSPHYAFTSSGQASGGIMHHTCNLPQSNYERFADYFLDITQHFIDDGVPVGYISPINEPQWKWGGKVVWQEGCHYLPKEMQAVFHVFAQKIEERGMSVKLYGPESGEILGLTEEYLDLLFEDDLTRRNLGVFAVHSYHADNNLEARLTFKQNILPKLGGLRCDMSEWCELPCKSPTDSIKGALVMARIIGWDLCKMGAESWTSWVAVNQYADFKGDGKDYSDGLLSATNGFSMYTINMRYWGMAHFTKFVDIGAKVLTIDYEAKDGLNIFPFKNPDGSYAVVFVNEGRAKDTQILASGAHMSVFSTTEKRILNCDYSGENKNGVHLKANSVTTVTVF